jgi:integrase
MACQVGRALDAYVAERADIVIDSGRLKRAARRLKGGAGAALGKVDAASRTALAAEVKAYTARRRKTVTGSTVRRELIVLRAALRHAWKAGRLAFPPYIAMPEAGPHRQRWLPRGEAQALLRCCDPAVYTFALIALCTGARLSAILELTWDRADLERRVIDFRAPHPKASRRKHRAVVPIADVLHRELRKDWRRLKPRGDDRVVPLSARRVQRLIRAAAEEAGLEAVTPHVLRHTAATWLLADGAVPLLMASGMLGHRSSLITEQVYTHLTAGHLTEAANVLGDMVGMR